LSGVGICNPDGCVEVPYWVSQHFSAHPASSSVKALHLIRFSNTWQWQSSLSAQATLQERSENIAKY
jgi:hypothetical protein